eukprot:scaffold126698_cov31-Attheya_sp.AAC.1
MHSSKIDQAITHPDSSSDFKNYSTNEINNCINFGSASNLEILHIDDIYHPVTVGGNVIEKESRDEANALSTDPKPVVRFSEPTTAKKAYAEIVMQREVNTKAESERSNNAALLTLKK